MTTATANTTRLFVSSGPTRWPEVFAATPLEVAGVASLGDIGDRATFEDYRVDQIDRPLKRRVGSANTTAEITVARDPFDPGQRALKLNAGTDGAFTFKATLDDGASSAWIFNACITSYTTKFPQSEDKGVVKIAFHLEIISSVDETNNIQ